MTLPLETTQAKNKYRKEYCARHKGRRRELKCKGYKITCDREENPKRLKNCTPCSIKPKPVTATDIGGRFATVEEMREQLAFENISMDGLLKRYPTADRFSLTGDYGDVYLDEESARAALKEIADERY